ncbi:MAG: universal stress protein [Chloroflexi bacterium]|nr:universal stress protein [Chloroflexota bacterium]
MIGKILVPLDGSPLAARALPYAEALARPTGARLLLVQAAWTDHAPDVDWGKSQARAVQEAETYLGSVAAELARRGLAAETAVPAGEASGAILDEIRLREADLVVMATHGRSGLDRWVYGSVAQGVLARSQVPVLLVRAWQEEVPPLGGHPRLLVPLDGSTFALAALPVAVGVADSLGGGELVLVRAAQLPEHAVVAEGRVIAYVDQQLESLKAEAQDYVQEVAGRLAKEHPALQVQFEVRVGPPAEAIVAASREHSASMVVMATHGRTGLSRLLLGSVAGAVLRLGSLPLLLVRPQMGSA